VPAATSYTMWPSTVAVVDSGVWCDHPELTVIGNNTWLSNLNFAGGNLSACFDAWGHGTHVAGIIGAKNQGSGIIGVAPGEWGDSRVLA
jgi:subtilisin family serine protease